MRWLVFIPLWAGCPKRQMSDTEELPELLVLADSAWALRGSDGLDPVEATLQRAYSASPASPQVAWRLSRLGVARGMTADEPAARVAAFGEARERSWACVLDDPSVRALHIEVGLVDALAALPPERQLCAIWAAHAWTRWMAEFGADGAALDLDILDVVIDYGAATGADPWTSSWTWALNRASRPEWAGRDRAAAAIRLHELLRDDIGRVEPLVDLYIYTARGANNENEVRARLQSAQPDTPEERAYMKRALKGNR